MNLCTGNSTIFFQIRFKYSCCCWKRRRRSRPCPQEGHQVRLVRRGLHEMPAQHLGSHALSQANMGHRTGRYLDNALIFQMLRNHSRAIFVQLLLQLCLSCSTFPEFLRRRRNQGKYSAVQLIRPQLQCVTTKMRTWKIGLISLSRGMVETYVREEKKNF